MSRYFSSRRRFSEPEKPEPRFQWRMRVNTLMMNDGNHSREDGSSKIVDETPGAVGGTGDVVRVQSPEANKSIETPFSLSFKERRERFCRTKSDGHLKLRVKFSRTIDDDGDSSDASPELSRRRGFLARSRTQGQAEISTRPESRFRRYQSQELGATSGSQAVPKAEGRAYDSTDGYPSGQAMNASRGAIPKRFQDRVKSYGSNDSNSSDENDFRRKRIVAKSSSPDSAIGESLPNTQAVSRERSPSVNDHEKPGISDGEEGSREERPGDSADYDSGEDGLPSHGQPRLSRDALTKSRTDHEGLRFEAHPSPQRSATLSCSARSHRSSSDEDAASDGGGEGAGTADDIEAIIEKIIAEEEQGETSSVESNLVTRMGDLLGSDARRYDQEMQQLQDTIDDCNRETAVSIELTRHNNQRASSVPSAGLIDDAATTTIIPYSSSYPLKQSCYRGAEEDNSEDDEDTSSEAEEVSSSWADLPLILMEDVLTLLTPKERHLASQVCRQWYDLFYSPRVWETFILLERTLTKKRFNLYKGYQRELCPGKTQICFRRVGSFFKRIVVTPITDYFNLYEFLRILAAFLQFREDHGESAMPLLHTFDFTFACATRGYGGEMIHGTGGQILGMIKELLTRMKGSLRHLKLNQLLLETSEISSLLDALVQCFSDCLHSLEILNVTKVPLPLEELAIFRSLVKLVISPQHLNDESVLMLSGINLLQLHILQDPYTCVCDPVASEAWKLAREAAPWLRVYLEVAGNTKTQLLIQPRAPVYGIFLRSPHGSLTHGLLMAVVENYAQTIRYFVQERLPRTHGPRGFEHRCDSALLFLVRRCPRLKTLVIRDRISTATLLLLATEGRGLTELLVRQNALIKRCDWPQRGEFPVELYKWLKKAALDYQRCTDQICATLKRRWRPMSDRQFKQLKIVPRLEMC